VARLASAFVPPHCPQPRCVFHRNPLGWRFKRDGFYTRRARPRLIQRYRCSHCRRSFSSQTFSPTYWLRRPDLLLPLYHGLLNCSGHRQLGRAHEISPHTVATHQRRLASQALLFLEKHRPPGPPRETLVVDGFESFERSQYHPFHANLAVGARSHFLYAFTDAELRRKGRMTSRQRRRRAELEERFGRADPKAIEREVAELLRLVLRAPGEVGVHSDEHPAYPRAFRRVAREGIAVRHTTTSSKRARTTGNPLFPVNRMDLLIRHESANHKRETIAYSKRRQSAMERLALFAVWVNFQKSRSEKRRDATPAEVLGLVDHKLSTREIYRERLFSTRIALPERMRKYAERRTPTRGLRCAAAPVRVYAS